MTAKQLFEYMLIEMNKLEAPSLTLEEYNYFINKAINLYLNERYNVHEINQQNTDDTSALKSCVIIDIDNATNVATASVTTGNILDFYANPTFPVVPTPLGKKFLLPDNYYHLTNCIVQFQVNTQKNCYEEGDQFARGAKRLTSDMYAAIQDNFYLKPHYKRPYYMITDNPSTPTVVFDDTGHFTNKVDGANNSEIEIRTGNHPNFEISRVTIDYLRVPQIINLTYTQAFDDTLAGSPTDTSQVLEFPNYVVTEIINRLTKLLMENASDQRAQTHNAVNQSIAPPQPGR